MTSGLDLKQGSAEWLAAKAGKFSGSRFTALMAQTKSGPAASRANLIVQLAVERLMGTCMDTYQSEAMTRGIDGESEAIRAYELERGVCVETVGLIQHPTLDYICVSPDGLIAADGMVEIKYRTAPNEHYQSLMFNAHAQKYVWQLQGQLWVTGRKWVEIVSYDGRFPPGLQLAICRVVRDEGRIAELEAACIAADAEVAAAVESLRRRAA